MAEGSNVPEIENSPTPAKDKSVSKFKQATSRFVNRIKGSSSNPTTEVGKSPAFEGDVIESEEQRNARREEWFQREIAPHMRTETRQDAIDRFTRVNGRLPEGLDLQRIHANYDRWENVVDPTPMPPAEPYRVRTMQGLEVDLYRAGLDVEQFYKDHPTDFTSRESYVASKMNSIQALYDEAQRRGINLDEMPKLPQLAKDATWEANRMGALSGPRLPEQITTGETPAQAGLSMGGGTLSMEKVESTSVEAKNPFEETQKIIRDSIARWEKEISELREEISDPNISDEYRMDIPHIIPGIEDDIEKAQAELAHPTWSAGIRPKDPEAFAYHGTVKEKLESIANLGLVPQPLKEYPSVRAVWFAGPDEASGYKGRRSDSDGALLRFPAGVVGRSRIAQSGGASSVSHGIPAYLIDVSQDGGKTWQPVAPPKNTS